MKFKAKRIAAIVAAVMMLGTLSASAEWYFAGYDTTDLGNIGKIYNEKINGKYTSKWKIDPVNPNNIEWKFEGYEYDYPHAGYDRLYVEGNRQLITAHNNLFPQWETRLKDYMWEISSNDITGGHRIYQRQQTKIPGKGWCWDFGKDDATESVLLTPTNRNADVSYSYKLYGVANLDLNGNFVSSKVADMYNYFGVTDNNYEPYNHTTGEITDSSNFFHHSNLSAIDENGHYVISDEEIADMACSIQSKFVTGPSFHGENGTKDVAKTYLANSDAGWEWDDDVVRYGGAIIDWTPVSYEEEEPYLQYQYLIVNGIIMDGRNDTPRVWRYTNGKATPKVEWKYVNWEDLGYDLADAPMASWPFNIVEWKYIDGKPAYNLDGTPVLRIPSGDYANGYFKVTDKEIQLWRQTGRGADEYISSVSRVHPTAGDKAGFVPGTIFYQD